MSFTKTHWRTSRIHEVMTRLFQLRLNDWTELKSRKDSTDLQCGNRFVFRYFWTDRKILSCDAPDLSDNLYLINRRMMEPIKLYSLPSEDSRDSQSLTWHQNFLSLSSRSSWLQFRSVRNSEQKYLLSNIVENSNHKRKHKIKFIFRLIQDTFSSELIGNSQQATPLLNVQ